MQTLRKFKRGDTFSLVAVITDDTGSPVGGVAAELRAEIRNRQDELQGACVIAETGTTGTYSLTFADTSSWVPDTVLYLDIQRTTGGVVSSTETIAIPVEKDVTR